MALGKTALSSHGLSGRQATLTLPTAMGVSTLQHEQSTLTLSWRKEVQSDLVGGGPVDNCCFYPVS